MKNFFYEINIFKNYFYVYFLSLLVFHLCFKFVESRSSSLAFTFLLMSAWAIIFLMINYNLWNSGIEKVLFVEFWMSTYNNNYISEFLDYLTTIELWKKRATDLDKEVIRQQEQLMKSQSEINTLQNKLKNARLLLDMEKDKRITCEEEKNDLVGNVWLLITLISDLFIDKSKLPSSTRFFIFS